MTNSLLNSTKPLEPNDSPRHFLSHRRHRWLVWSLLAVSPLGFLDATYLSLEHYLNRAPPCSLTNGCEIVTTSSYSLLFGIPVALLGAVYYLVIIIGLVYYLDSKKPFVIKWVSRLTAAGFIFSIYLVYLQVAVLHAICLYCMLSALSSTALFILGLMVLKLHRVFERRSA